MHVHLAILQKEYLKKILHKRKTIESRFSKIKCAPFKVVREGDLIFLKESSGLVLGKATAGKVLFYSQLDFDKIKEIINEYGYGLCLEDPFIQRISNAKYGTLIFLKNITAIRPVKLTKKNRLGWIVLTSTKYYDFKRKLLN